MKKAHDPHDSDFRGTLPADLQALDRELSGIRIEERPSFGPELEAELARVWRERTRSRPSAVRPWVRTLLAAGFAGLMIAGVSVPAARGAVIQLVRTVAEQAFPSLFAPEPEPVIQLPEIQVQEPLVTPEPRSELVVSPADASDGIETSQPDLPTIPEVVTTFPELVSRTEASAIIASYYPVELQRDGVEGVVKLMFWVGAEGIPESIQKRVGSGNSELDYAAMRAARDLRFRPATRNGVPVGTWVEVDVRFFALSGLGIIGSDTTDTKN